MICCILRSRADAMIFDHVNLTPCITQAYDNYFIGSLDPNSDKSTNPEYARRLPAQRRWAPRRV